MPTYAYLFEAKSIQSFILATNRLKEIVGASELVEWLTGSLPTEEKKGGPPTLLNDVLKVVDGGEKIRFSRCGGGAFYAFSEDAAAIERLATLWPLAMRQFAPDVEFVQARGEGANAAEAFSQARERLLADRNRHAARLPQAGPLARRDRRTGEPASAYARDKKDKSKKVAVDGATRRKLDFSRGGRLGGRFGPDYPWDIWPLNLSPDERGVEIDGEEPEGSGRERDFPFVGDSRAVAVVHADGNGLGQLLMDLSAAVEGRPEIFIDSFRAFSSAVSDATQAAAQTATQEVLEAHREPEEALAARPIVLGGDDVTILVRADLALPFTRRFLTAFSDESRRRLKPLKKQFGIDLPPRLTACAGIAYVKSTQPFHLALGLAEGLCRYAKGHAKPLAGEGAEVPPALAFHRVTTAMVDEYEEILGRELTAGDLRQTLGCYAVEPTEGLPLLDDLLELRALLDGDAFSRGPNRELLGLVGSDRDQALRRYGRWREVMAARGEKAGQDPLRRFDEAFERLVSLPPGRDLPYGPPDPHGLRHSPLGDVNTLQSIGSL